MMTSANPGGEPLVIDNDEALARLHGIADALLLHDRDIVARCDDSVLRLLPSARRSSSAARAATRRAPIKLPRAGPPVLATGAWLKNTVCLTRGDEAFLSPHIGDLDNAATCDALVEMVAHLCAVLDVQPQAVAHDLHPDFFSTRFALRVRRSERGTAAASPCSTTMPTSPPWLPNTACRARCWAWRWTASAWATTARPGAANCCASTARTASGWATWRRSPCPAATSRRASPGAWPRRRCTRSAAATRSRRASATGRPPARWRRCWRAACAARPRRAWAAGSTPRPACWACATAMRLRRPGADAAGSAGRRAPATPAPADALAGLVRCSADGVLDPLPAARAPGRRRRCRARRGAVPPRLGRRPGALGGKRPQRAAACARVALGRRLLPQRTARARCCAQRLQRGGPARAAGAAGAAQRRRHRAWARPGWRCATCNYGD